MQLQQRLEQTQKLILTQSMQQSLHCLQLPILELRGFLEEAALSNPLLDVEDASLSDVRPETVERRSALEDSLPIERREQVIWESGAVPPDGTDFTACYSRPQSFTDYLNDQLGQTAGLDANLLALCRFLVGCLNSAGYLDIPLAELAEELHQPLFDLEQALFAVQSLDPPGAGARNLSECLLLQLAQGREFNAVNIHLIREGLPLLAEKDYAGLSRLLGVGRQEVLRSAQVIRSLNPIPSRGFFSESTTAYILPEATVRCDRGEVTIEMNERFLPRVSLNPGYCALLGSPECQDAQLYLKEKLAEAKSLISNVHSRHDTIFRLLCAVVREQKDYFLDGDDLRPMTQKELADALSLNTSTVSRAVKDKYIQFNGRTLPLRGLFTASLQTTDGQAVSAETARRQIRRFTGAEDPRRPLSDADLCEALAGVGIVLSRRTVAKYRGELEIPCASKRRGVRASGNG